MIGYRVILSDYKDIFTSLDVGEGFQYIDKTTDLKSRWSLRRRLISMTAAQRWAQSRQRYLLQRSGREGLREAAISTCRSISLRARCIQST